MQRDRHAQLAAVGRRRRRLRQVRCAAAGIALWAASAVAAQMLSIPLGGPPKVRPSPNAALLGAPADIAAAVAGKGRPSAMRSLDASRHPVEVLEYLGLSRGVRVLVVERDLGYYGEIIGAAVGPDGRVTELISPAAMQDPATRSRLSDAISLAPSLSLLAAVPATARLAPGSFDFVLLHLALGRLASTAGVQTDDITPFLQKLFAAVRPGGIVGVVDGGAADDDDAVATTSTDAASVRRDFARAGFVLDSEGHVRGDDDGGVQPAPGTAAAVDPRRFILKFRKPE